VAPFSVAVIVAAPAATPVTIAVALDAPAATVTGVCTVAIAGLLLETAMVTAFAAAAFNVTVACTVLPGATVVALSVTADTPVVSVGDVADLEHCVNDKPRASVTISLMNGFSPRVNVADNGAVGLAVR
jgi:hypothetical protein